MTSTNIRDCRTARRLRQRWSLAIAGTFLLWAVVSTARVVTASAQAAPQQPAAQTTQPKTAPAEKKTPPPAPADQKKKSRFASIEEDEQAPPPQTARPEQPDPKPAEQPKKSRFASVEEEETQPAPTQPPAPDQKKSRFALDEDRPEPAQKPDSPYTGTAKCVRCHAKQAKPYFSGPHGKDWDGRSPASDLGCETCHGPGLAHDLDPGAKGLVNMPPKMSPREATRLCLRCHDRQHAGWAGSQHDARNLTCVNCHSMHKPKAERGLLKGETVVATCAACHRDKAARLQRSSHMPMREGKMECSTCHDPHGSSNVRLLRVGNTINESCQSCHPEKRGPFLWDHAPVAEKCSTCHDPHGSFNNRMLVAKDPMLCQRCHVGTRHPATPYDGAALLARNNRLINRGCVNCHQLIHGSNHPSGEFFQR